MKASNGIGLIPKTLRQDGRVENGAKVLFAELDCINRSKGFVDETNNQLGAKLSASGRTISKWIASLAKFGYVEIEGISNKENLSEFSITIKGRSADQSKKTMVYLMRNENSDYYKIGYSVNPKSRASDLSTPVNRVRVEFFVNGGLREEKTLHAEFSGNSISGEWFRFSKEDVSNVKIKMKEIEQK